MASYVLISALAVPVISSNAPGTGNLNKTKSDFLQGDQEGRSRTGRLTSLLGLSRTPTRAGLLKEALNRDILKKARPELRELFNILEVEFHPLSICAKIEPILSQLAQDKDMAQYVKPLHSVVLTRLFQQLSQVYDAVKLSKVMQLVSAFKTPHNYTAAEIEKFCLNACKKGHLNIRIDHVAQAISFQDDVFSTEAHPAASTSSEADNVRLQATPSELVRTQLSRLAQCLDTTVKIIDPSILAQAEASKSEVFARAVAAAEEEHKAAVARKAILARRKELLEEMASRKEREETAARTERTRLAAEAEQKRLADEIKKREQDRIHKELEAVRIEEAKKMAKSLQERGGLKLTEEELTNMDTNKLVQMQVEQIEKEKKELAERLRVIHRRMDHVERAYRREEAPLLSSDYERQKEEDLRYHKAARITLLETSKEKHAADLEIKQRLTRILPDYTELRKVIEDKRRGEFEERRKKAAEQIELEKEKRRQEVRARREKARREAEEAERTRAEREEQERREAEETERQAEQQRVEQEERAELEAKKRAEIEERTAKLQAQAALQRKREEEAEAKMRARSSGAAVPGAGRGESPSAAAPDASAWRTSRPSPAATTATTESQRPSLFGGKAGGWREKEAARKAAGGSGDVSPSPLSPAPARASPVPSAAAAAAPPASGAYRPGMLKAAAGGAPSWREREAAKKAAAGADGSSPAASNTYQRPQGRQ